MISFILWANIFTFIMGGMYEIHQFFEKRQIELNRDFQKQWNDLQKERES